MIPALAPVAEAALFTLGCMAIHALRRHADTVTATLACFATILVLLLGIAFAPAPATQYSAGDFVMVDPAIY